jgi:hypothetical protein
MVTSGNFVGEDVASPSLSITIELRGDQLQSSTTGRGFYRIFYESDKVFKLKVKDAMIEFITLTVKSVNGYVVTQYFQIKDIRQHDLYHPVLRFNENKISVDNGFFRLPRFLSHYSFSYYRTKTPW